MNYKHFSEYRPSDYRTPRSMKEAFGDDGPLYVETSDASLHGAFWFAFYSGIVIWWAYGWIR